MDVSEGHYKYSPMWQDITVKRNEQKECDLRILKDRWQKIKKKSRAKVSWKSHGKPEKYRR